MSERIPPLAEIVTIGDELLIGQVINTNQAYIAGQLNGAGIGIAGMTTVGDDLPAILDAFQSAWTAHQVVIVTGGLGPTHDDITKKAVCRFFDSDLVANEDLRRHIGALLAKRNIPWNDAAEEQTLIPRKATLIPNPVGTAAGFWFNKEERHFIVLPGVPYEMKEMMDQTVTPLLAARFANAAIRHLTLRTTGISESALAKDLGDVEQLLNGASLAFLPSPTGVRLRITVEETSAEAAEKKIEEIEQRIRERAGKYIYAAGEVELEETLGKLLTERRLTIAVAESCTGGLIADRITNVSGSSTYFERGVVTYSNRSKIELLNVPASMIEEHGAVSKEVAEAMAEGIRRLSGSGIGLSTTGIAGPTGGSAGKPVGLVWIGYSDSESTFAMRFHFGDMRRLVKERASQAALEIVRRRILGR